MTMTMNKLAAACSVALATGVAQANTLADFDASDVVVYAGGATATDGVLENLARAVIGGYCLPGTIDIFTAPNQRAVFCETNGSRVPGFPSSPNTQVAFLKESAGGSSNGVNPLIAVANGAAHSLRWLDLAALKTAGTCTTVPLLATDTGQAGLHDVTRRWSCPLTLTAPDTPASTTFDVNLGVSDTEPALAFPRPTTTDIGRLAVMPAVHISFGVPVTETLYRALQEAQGLTVGSDALADVPSLSRSQIRGLFSGGVTDWNQITDENGTGLFDMAAAPGGVPPPADTLVYVCRRVGSSGTQATAEAYWLQQRCIDGGSTFVEPNDGSTVSDVSWVTADPNNGNVNAGPSSGNVRSCLAIYNNANRWGVGVLSNEVASAQMVGFRMVAIDGVTPDLANHANGYYDYYSESVTNTIASGNPGFIPPSDLRKVLITHIQGNISEPVTLAQLNVPFANRPWGDGGVMAIPNGVSAVANSAPVTPAEMAINPVDSSSKFGNNCSDPVMFNESPVWRGDVVRP